MHNRVVNYSTLRGKNFGTNNQLPNTGSLLKIVPLNTGSTINLIGKFIHRMKNILCSFAIEKEMMYTKHP